MLNNEDIYSLVENHGGGISMSDFQARYFVVNSQITPYRKVRQALLEIENRIASRKQMERDRRKCEIRKSMHLRDKSMEQDPLAAELIQCEIDQLDYDISVYNKKLRNCEDELRSFSEIVKELVPDVAELEKFKVHDEVKEQEYWIARMAKQAAMDVIAFGKVAQGNLDSIAMMPLDVQQETLKVAMKYGSMLNQGMDLLETQALQELAQVPAQLTFVDDLPYSKMKIENKAQGEDI